MSKIKIGDLVICTNADGMEAYALQYGQTYTANTVMDIPGQGSYVGVMIDGGLVVVDKGRFEPAYKLSYRVWKNDGSYVLMDESFDEAEYAAKDGDYVNITITLPESQLENIEGAIQQAVIAMREMPEKE